MDAKDEPRPTNDLPIAVIESRVLSWHANQKMRTASRCSYETCTCRAIADLEGEPFKGIDRKVRAWHEKQIAIKSNRCSYQTCTCLNIIDPEIGALKEMNKK